MKQALIIHGYGGNKDGNWFPWLRQELEKIDFKVDNPQFPHADEPQEQEWTQTIMDLWKPENQPSSDTSESEKSFRTIIGHSLGGTEVLRALELDWQEPIDLAVIVAATNNDSRRPALANFFTTPFNFEKIRRNAKKIILIFSDSDPHIKPETGPYFQQQLGATAELFMLSNAGHFMDSDGYKEFPLLYDLIKKNC